VFDYWENSPLKTLCHNSFSFFEEQIRKNKECPKIFQWIPAMWFPPNQPEGIHTEEGKILEITYNPSQVTIQEIEDFFREYKVHVHHADPFIVKNNKTFDISHLEFKKIMKWIRKLF